MQHIILGFNNLFTTHRSNHLLQHESRLLSLSKLIETAKSTTKVPVEYFPIVQGATWLYSNGKYHRVASADSGNQGFSIFYYFLGRHMVAVRHDPAKGFISNDTPGSYNELVGGDEIFVAEQPVQTPAGVFQDVIICKGQRSKSYEYFFYVRDWYTCCARNIGVVYHFELERVCDADCSENTTEFSLYSVSGINLPKLPPMDIYEAHPPG